MAGWSEGSGRTAGALQVLRSTAGADQQPADHVAKLLDEICELISHITQAPTVIIDLRLPKSGDLKVLGKTGTLMTEFQASCAVPDLDAQKQPFMVSDDIRRDPRFRGHPLLKLMPHVQSVMAFVIPGTAETLPVVLKVMNPRKTAFANGDLMRLLSELSVIISDVLKLAPQNSSGSQHVQSHTLVTRLAGLQQADNTVPSSNDEARSASTFLFETLVKKRGLHSRNAVDYVSLRTWRLPLKKYQIGALRALKQSPPQEFAAQVAAEIAASVQQTHGLSVIKSVVPVPPGSSGGENSLSTLVAEQVAVRLTAAYCNVLQLIAPVRKGKSTPRVSASLEGYKLTERPAGPVLIIDDVASSGRHIELAVSACKPLNTPVYAMVWIAK